MSRRRSTQSVLSVASRACREPKAATISLRVRQPQISVKVILLFALPILRLLKLLRYFETFRLLVEPRLSRSGSPQLLSVVGCAFFKNHQGCLQELDAWLQDRPTQIEP